MQVYRIDTTTAEFKDYYFELLTEAGIVRVVTHMVDNHTLGASVVVEVEPNLEGRPRTEQGGHWTIEMRDHEFSGRTEIVLKKDG